MIKNKSQKKLKLIVHIGAGKTGSSSIQQTLLKNASELKLQNTKYLGLMFEHAFKTFYHWQYACKIEEYYAMDSKVANEQLLDTLTEIISEEKKNGITKLIWSNESLLGKSNYIITALKKLSENDNIDIKFIVYVRNYLKWSQSAYKQWGIKHKTYEGQLQSFSKWKGHKIPFFYKMLEPLYHEFPNRINIRNMDAVDNVVEDFCTICNINTHNLTFVRDNDSPKIEELYLRATYNNQFNTTVLPYEYDNIIGQLPQLEQPIDSIMDNFLPNKIDLEQINKITADDQKQINYILKEQGQSILKNNITEEKSSIKINLHKLINGLTELIVKQSIKLDKLEKEMNILKEILKR